jgi:hypothetical protein
MKSRLRKHTSFVNVNSATARTQNKFSSKKCALFVHGEDFSVHDVLVNTQVFPHFNIGDVIEIVSYSGSEQEAISSSEDSNNANNEQQETLMITLDANALQQTKGVQFVSVLKSIADLYGLSHRREVLIRCVKPERAYLDYVELAVKDHFISRSDMYRFSLFLSNKSVHTLKHIQWNGYSAQVKELIRKTTDPNSKEQKNKRVSAGLIVHEHTKITFRSRSAILYWMFQMSKEMWEYTTAHEYEDGNLHFEKGVTGFVKEIFERWKSLDVNHSVSMIFFSRHYIVSEGSETLESDITWDQEFNSMIQTKDGSKYIDVYKVIDWNETQNVDMQGMLVRLKEEFISYPLIIQRIAAKRMFTLFYQYYVY